VGEPLAVLVGLKEPQGDVEQVADQLTPPWAGSFATVAVICNVAPCATVCGVLGERVTEIGGGVTVTVIEAVLLLSPPDVAVTVTARFAETGAGAV
jgi:hypothetical protein